MRVLGIDPGSSATGYGLVERQGSRLVHLAHGTLRSPRRRALAVRLAALREELADVALRAEADVAVVERVFVAASPRSALVLGQARGVALAAVAGAGLPVEELSPQAVKRAVTGSGAAAKRQVQAMVRRLLGLESLPPSDAADALAAAICRAHAGASSALAESAAPRRRARSGARGGARRRGDGVVMRRAR